MINFNAEIEKFDTKGEKTGWTYVFIPVNIANQIMPGTNFFLKRNMCKGFVAGLGN